MDYSELINSLTGHSGIVLNRSTQNVIENDLDIDAAICKVAPVLDGNKKLIETEIVFNKQAAQLLGTYPTREEEYDGEIFKSTIYFHSFEKIYSAFKVYTETASGKNKLSKKILLESIKTGFEREFFVKLKPVVIRLIYRSNKIPLTEKHYFRLRLKHFDLTGPITGPITEYDLFFLDIMEDECK